MANTANSGAKSSNSETKGANASPDFRLDAPANTAPIANSVIDKVAKNDAQQRSEEDKSVGTGTSTADPEDVLHNSTLALQRDKEKLEFAREEARLKRVEEQNEAHKRFADEENRRLQLRSALNDEENEEAKRSREQRRLELEEEKAKKDKK